MNSDATTLLGTEARLDKLFLHYFDVHFLADKGRVVDTKPFIAEMRRATRLAIASAGTTYIPAASYFESPVCRQIIDGLDELVALGLIVLSGNSGNLDEFIQERSDESFYRKGSSQYDSYRIRRVAGTIPPFITRNRSATRDIVEFWKQKVSNDDISRMLREAAGCKISELECRLERVPYELGSLAFIPEHVYDVLDLNGAASTTCNVGLMKSRIRSVINEAYFTSYMRDLNAGVVVDLRYLSSDFQLLPYGRNLSYRKMVRFLQVSDRLKYLDECNLSQLVILGNEPDWQRALQSSVSYLGQHNLSEGSEISPRAKNSTHTTNTMLEKGLELTVLCVAAAAIEFAAIRTCFSDMFGGSELVHLDDARNEYALKFVDPQSHFVWYLAGQDFQGQTAAALRVRDLCDALQPTLTLMVGMCMALPKYALPVGTVVVPNEVYSFDHQRLTAEGAQHRPHGGDMSNSGLYRLARLIGSDASIQYKVIVDKGLASSSTKVEDINSDLVKRIENTFPDIAVYDMEGSGFYQASAGRPFLWVKAVADSGEAQSTIVGARNRKHEIQFSVTANAVDFAVRVVRAFADSALQ